MEQYYDIPTSDGFEIPGILNWKEPSKKLIVLVHGFKGSMTEAHFISAKEYFIEKGYAVFRFNLYSEGENHRKLHTTTVVEHSRDLENILSYFSQEYEEISLVGHSLGCPTIIGISHFPKNTKSIIFWDPALSMKESAGKIFQRGEAYVVPSTGKLVEVSEKMLEEFHNSNYLDDLSAFSCLEKVKIIYASNERHVLHKPKTDVLGIPSIIIEGANHGFSQEGKYEELFERTLEFIER